MIQTANLNGKPRQAHLLTLWQFVARNRLLVLGLPVIVLLATAAFLRFTTPIYESAVSIRIDEQRSSVAVLDALKSLSSGSEINTDMEELRSRTLAEEIVDSLRLQLSVEQPRRVARSAVVSAAEVSRAAPAGTYTLDKIAAGKSASVPGASVVFTPAAASESSVTLHVEPFQQAVRTLAKELDVSRPNREANFVVVKYRSTDRELVRAVPDLVAARFIARRNRVRTTEATSTVRFLDEQLDRLKAQLTQAEDEVRHYREGAQIVAPKAQAEAEVTRLAEIQAQRDLQGGERDALANFLNEVTASAERSGNITSPYRRLVGFPTLFKNPATAELLRNLTELENQRAELLDRRTTEDPEVKVLSARISDLEKQLGTIAMSYLSGLQNQVAATDATLQRFGKQLLLVPAREVQYARLQRQASVLEEIYTLLEKRHKEAQIAAAIEDPTVRVVDPAITPLKPIWPKNGLSLLLSVLVGLALGVGAAFAREHMDNTIHTREELQLATANLPVLGTIPRIREVVVAKNGAGTHKKKEAVPAFHSRLVAGRDPRSPASEAYRSLRTNITFSRIERPPRTVVFTSPTPGDGKSTSASNLAITLAQQELRCLLIDADMRRGVLHEVFGIPREPGLSDILLGRVTAAAAIQNVTVGDNVKLNFISMGTVPPNPSELLASTRVRKLLDELQEQYDTIIIDAPPLTVVTDAALLGTQTDGVILVTRAGVTDRGALAYSLEQLNAVRAPLLGAILNDVDVKKNGYYGSYGAAHAYYSAPVPRS